MPSFPRKMAFLVAKVCTLAMFLSARRSESSEAEAGSETNNDMPLSAAGVGRMVGLWSVNRYTSAEMGSSGPRPSPRMRNGTHGLGSGMVRSMGVPSPFS